MDSREMLMGSPSGRDKQRTTLSGESLGEQTISRRTASQYYQGAEGRTEIKEDGVQRSKDGLASGRRNDTGGFFTVGDSANGMRNGKLTRRVQDWALGDSWRESGGPSSGRLKFDPRLRNKPGQGATVKELRAAFTAECGLEVPPGAKWFAEGIGSAGLLAIPKLDHTSKHAQLRYEEWDDRSEQIMTRFCCTL